MRIEPKYDWVVIDEEIAAERGRTEMGIIMPHQMGEEVRRGTVVAVGIGKCLEDGTVREPQTPVGAYVLFMGDGLVFMNGAKPYRAIKEEDIICEVNREQ